MNKDQRAITLEYTSSMADDDLRELAVRLSDRLFLDLAEALNLMSKNARMDAMLYATNSGDELYRLCDKIRDIAVQEARRRKLDLKSIPASN